MSGLQQEGTSRTAAANAASAAARGAASCKRRQGILGMFTAAAELDAPAPSRAELVAGFRVSPLSIKGDLAALRAAKLIRSESRKYRAKPADEKMTVELRHVVKIGTAWRWTAWPTDGKPVKARSAAPGLPPEFWTPKPRLISPAVDHAGVVERAKNDLRRAWRVPVYHCSTVDNPTRAFVPSRTAGEAWGVVGTRVMTEGKVVELARGLVR